MIDARTTGGTTGSPAFRRRIHTLGESMAKIRLTVSVDEAVARAAREYAARTGVPLSDLVGRFLRDLPLHLEYPPVLRRLIGILPPDCDESDYHRHLEKKYGA